MKRIQREEIKELQKKIKKYKQKTKFTCGATCLKMLLEVFDINKSEEELMNILDSKEILGTSNIYFPKVAEEFKLDYAVARNSNIKRLKSVTSRYYLVVVCYYDKKEHPNGHYLICKNVGIKYISLIDPKYGKVRKMEISNFEKKWKNNPKGLDKEECWYFGLKDNRNSQILSRAIVE